MHISYPFSVFKLDGIYDRKIVICVIFDLDNFVVRPGQDNAIFAIRCSFDFVEPNFPLVVSVLAFKFLVVSVQFVQIVIVVDDKNMCFLIEEEIQVLINIGVVFIVVILDFSTE